MTENNIMKKKAFKSCDIIEDDERFYKLIITEPVGNDGELCILKITGFINTDDIIRAVIIFEYQNREKNTYSLSGLTRDNFDDILGEILIKSLSRYFNDPENHFKEYDVSTIDNIEDQLKYLQENNVIEIYKDAEEYEKGYEDRRKQRFHKETLH